MLSKAQTIGQHVRGRHDAAIASAPAAAKTARRLGIVAGLLALLLATAAAFLVVRGIRRGVTPILDRLSSLTGDSDALARALDAAATGDLTLSASAKTTPIEHCSSDEIGQVADAVNTIRDRTEASSDAYNRMVGGPRELISDVSSAAGTVSASSQQMVGTADEAGRAVGEIAHAIGDPARAGEQGRGFAMVAEEVRKLAEESQTAAATITRLIEEIQHETQRAVTVVETGASRTEQGVETVQQAGATFLELGASVEETGRRMEEIAGAIASIADTSARIREQMDEVADVAERSSASTEQVSASSQQTSASAQEIAASAHDLAQTAASLEQFVGRFTLTA